MPLTPQNLVDAETDIANIAAVANGGDAEIVVTRTGQAIKTLSHVIRELAQSTLTPPDYQGPAGPPGGNSESIGPFMTASGSTIAAGVKSVRTSCYQTIGDFGGAIMIEVAAQPTHPIKFQSADGRWWGLSPAQVHYAEMFGAKADGTNDQPAIQAGLNASVVSVLHMLPRTYKINSRVVIPSNKWWQGATTGGTVIGPLSTYTPRTADFNQAITCDATATNVRCTDMTWDGGKVGIGLGTTMRICGFVPSGTNFYFARLRVLNCSGYAIWTFGKADGTPCSGTVEDVISINANIHFESSKAIGVDWMNCHARVGDNDLGNASAFHPYDGSTDIHYIRCTASGAIPSPMHSIADTKDIKIRMTDCDIATTYADAAALQPTNGNLPSPAVGTYKTTLELFGGSFTSTAGNGASIQTGTTLKSVGATINGWSIGVGVGAGATAILTATDVEARTATTGGPNTWALSLDASSVIVTTGGTLAVYGTPGAIAVSNGLGSLSIGRTTRTIPSLGTSLRQEKGGQVNIIYSAGSGTGSQYFVDITLPSAPVDPTKVSISTQLVHVASDNYGYLASSPSLVFTRAPGIAGNVYRGMLTGVDLGTRTAGVVDNYRCAYEVREWE